MCSWDQHIGDYAACVALNRPDGQLLIAADPPP